MRSDGSDVWKKFINNPNEVNYLNVSKQLDESLEDKSKRFESLSYLAITSSGVFGGLLDLISEGNIYAAELGFKLMPLLYGDSERDEYLSIYLGKLIKLNPELFLSLLTKYRQNVGYLGSLIGNYGDAFVDDFPKQLEETRARMKSLRQIDKPNLINIRNECLEDFMKHEKELIEGIEKFNL